MSATQHDFTGCNLVVGLSSIDQGCVCYKLDLSP